MELLRKHLLREGPIDKEHLVELIKELTGIMSKSFQIKSFLFYDYSILEKEPNVIRMKEPVIIVGDIHG